jgi:hypothetical protein
MSPNDGTLPEAHVVHRLPGRVRLRVPSRRGDRDWFSSAVVELAMARGVLTAKADPRLASLLIHHDGPLQAIAAAAERGGLFRLMDLAPRPESLLGEMQGEAAAWNAGLRRAAGDADLASLAFLGLCLSALWQLARGQILPPAATLAWYAAYLLQATARQERTPID